MNAVSLLRSKIENKVEIFNLGNSRFFLSMQINRDRNNNKLFLSQFKYINELLVKFEIIGDKPIYSPTIQGIRLEKSLEQASVKNIKKYQQQIESLMYLITSTRLDLAFAVSNCAKYMSNPNKEHFNTLNRIWQYLRTTKEKELLYNKSNPKLIGYVDSNWGGNYSTRKSTFGYIFLLGNTPISWSSKLQKSVALSSCEAEYMVLKEATKELLWLKFVFKQISLIN